jgi:hypothetical protein
MVEAELRHLESILDDVVPLLGPGVVVEGFGPSAEGEAVTLEIRYRLGPVATTSRGRGDTIVAAHAALRQALVEDRVALAIRALIAR